MIKMTTFEFTTQWQEIITELLNNDYNSEVTIPVRDIQFFVNCTKVAIEQGLIENREISVSFGSKGDDRR